MMLDVSVVIPAYGRPDELDRALQSVERQTAAPREVIVVDDASECEIVIEHHADVRLVRRSTNGGAAAARNTGVSVAVGAMVAFLDSDDEWLPEFLEQAVTALEAAGPDVAAVTTGYETRYTSGRTRIVVPGTPTSLREVLLRGCPYAPGSTLVVRRAALAVVGSWDESLRRYEDYDWLLRLAATHRLCVVPQVLVTIHSEDLAPLDLDLAARTTARLIERPPVALSAQERKVWRAAMLQEVAWAAWRSRKWLLFGRVQLGAIVLDPSSRLLHLVPRLLARGHHHVKSLIRGRRRTL